MRISFRLTLLLLSVAIGTASTAPALAARGVLLILNKSADTLAFVDPDSLAVIGTLATGDAPHEVAVDASGATAYVANYGTASAPGNTISIVDVPARRVTGVIDLGPHTRPHGIVVARDGALWITCEGSKTVLVVDPKERRILRSFETGQEVTHMIALTPDGHRAFTANIGSDTVTLIDLAGGTTTHIAVGEGPEGIDISPDGSEVWVAHRGDGGLSILDAGTGRVLHRLSRVGEMPIRVKFTPDGSRVLISCARGNDVAVYDARERKAIARIATGEAPIGILVAPDGDRAFVANTAADKVSVLDLKDAKVVGSIAPGEEPDGLGWGTAETRQGP